jgi:hypothetical protein
VRFPERAVVPPYEGSMIRGAFGRVFKESCCPFPQTAEVTRSERCPYAYDFETSPPENAWEFSVADGARVVFQKLIQEPLYLVSCLSAQPYL